MANYSRQAFIDKVSPLAIQDMRKTGVPASLTIAQAILESSNGNSALTRQANNLFGMKGTGTAGSVQMLTREYVNGQWKEVMATFRKYHNWEESISDHSNLILNGVSWNRNLYRGAVGVDGVTACRVVARAGYATDPKYEQKLIDLVVEHELLRYDFKATYERWDSEVFEQLQKSIGELNARVKELEERMKEVPAPEWFLKEFPHATELIHQKTGTYDFWRSFAVILRVVKSYHFSAPEKH